MDFLVFAIQCVMLLFIVNGKITSVHQSTDRLNSVSDGFPHNLKMAIK